MSFKEQLVPDQTDTFYGRMNSVACVSFGSLKTGWKRRS